MITLIGDTHMTKKVFISYSWTSEDHKNRIVKIAESLMRDHGINIILDLWDCKPGQDLNVFMESMVLDETVDYVLVMSDKRYKDKANSREGGVGTESTIISAEVYKDVSNTKFIPVYMEMINGEVSLPQFCKTRRAINMTNEEDDYESIEEIARWINNKPIYTKPAIGKVPDYTFNSTSLKSYEQKLYMSKSYTLEDNLMSYFDILKTELLNLEDKSDNDVNDDVILSIKPYLESLRRFYDFVSEKELDVSSYIIPLYNDLLEHTKNETERPLLRLFLYFSFLEIVLASFTKNDLNTLKNLILSDYIFLGRKTHFAVLSNFPRKYAEHPFFVSNNQSINIRRFCAQLLYDDKKKSKIEDIDLILNTICEINSSFAEEWPSWHGSLLYFNFDEYYSWNNQAHYIVEKFKYKDFYERYKFLFGCEKDEFISRLNSRAQKRISFREMPLINKVLDPDEIAKY